MFNLLKRELPLASLALLAYAGVAQAQVCGKNSAMACDITVTPPGAPVTLICGTTTPAAISYVITNNTPAPKNVSYSLIEAAIDPVPDPDSGGSVEIDTLDTGLSCGGTVTIDGGSTTLAAGASCTVTIDVIPDADTDLTACIDGADFNWELEVVGAFPQSGDIINVLLGSEINTVAPPIPPDTFTCPSGIGEAPLCSSADFCVSGYVAVDNTDHTATLPPHATVHTTLTDCYAGTETTMQLNGGNLAGTAATCIAGAECGTSGITAADAQEDIAELITEFAAEAAALCGGGLGFPIYPGQSLGNAIGATYPVLPRGLYCFGTSAMDLKDTLTLEGSSTDQFIFVTYGDFAVTRTLLGSGVSVAFAGGALPENVYWVVLNNTTGVTTTINPGSGTTVLPGSFQGNVYSIGGITVSNFVDAANSRLFSSTGAVTLNSNILSTP